MKTRHELYRHFDADNNLLYVGISKSAIARLSQHSLTGHWYDSICRVTIERFNSREELEQAEKRAIKNESPKYNIVHNYRTKTKLPKKDKAETTINYSSRVVAICPRCNGLYQRGGEFDVCENCLEYCEVTLRDTIKFGAFEARNVRITSWQPIPL